MLGAAYILFAMAFGVRKTQQSIFFSPVNLTAVGLLVALLSGLPALLTGNVIMTGEWVTLFSQTAFELKLGTPLLFDVGVYLAVAGMLMLVMFSIMEE